MAGEHAFQAFCRLKGKSACGGLDPLLILFFTEMAYFLRPIQQPDALPDSPCLTFC